MTKTVKTKKYWVWTEKAVKLNPYQKAVGEPIWEPHQKEAPAHWLEDGLIEEVGQEKLPVGQAAFDFES